MNLHNGVAVMLSLIIGLWVGALLSTDKKPQVKEVVDNASERLDLWAIASQAKDAKEGCEKSLPRNQFCTITFTATKPEEKK